MKRFKLVALCVFGLAVIAGLILGGDKLLPKLGSDYQSKSDEIYIAGGDKNTTTPSAVKNAPQTLTKEDSQVTRKEPDIVPFKSDAEYVKVLTATNTYTSTSALLPGDFTTMSFAEYAVLVSGGTDLKKKNVNLEMASKRVIWSGYVDDIDTYRFKINLYPDLSQSNGTLFTIDKGIRHATIEGPIDVKNVNQFSDLNKGDYITIQGEIGIYQKNFNRIELFNTTLLRVNDKVEKKHLRLSYI